MSNQVKELAQKVDALTVRERVMILLAVLVVLFMAWDNFLWQPMAKQQQQVQSQLTESQNAIKLLEVQISGVVNQAKIDPNADLKKQLENSRASLKQIDKRIKSITSNLVAPSEMASLLESLLTKQGALRLTELKTLGSTPLIGDAVDRDKGSETADESQGSGLNLYRHGFILEFEGDYFSVLSYLKQLEALQSVFFWDGVEYEVADYPVARVRLQIHTLSFSKGWIGV